MSLVNEPNLFMHIDNCANYLTRPTGGASSSQQRQLHLNTSQLLDDQVSLCHNLGPHRALSMPPHATYPSLVCFNRVANDINLHTAYSP
jgi:hypothetical protein